MAANITVCGLTNIEGFNPNGVYTITGQQNGRDAWDLTLPSDPVLGARTFVVEYYDDGVTKEWHLTDVQSNYGAWHAIGLDAVSPWLAEWNDNGYGYGTAVVTEGGAGCVADPYAPWGGFNNYKRLKYLEYV
jgi:hypothetical protein